MNYRVVNIQPQTGKDEKYSVLIIYTGGTMGMSYNDKATLSPFNFEEIINEMPVLKSMDLELAVVSFSEPIDSSNVTIDHWNLLASIIEKHYADYHGFVVLHGTDTLAYSASALSFMLDGLQKPVIFTGSQLPMGAVRTDANQNLIAALQIASSYDNRGPLVQEVCVYFDYFLYRGNRCKKVESVHFDAFESENYPPLAEVGISIDYNFASLNIAPSSPLNVLPMKPTSIALIKLFPGLNEQLFKHTLQTPGLQGVVLETFGSGNAPTVSWFIQCINEAISNNIIIFNVSQCNGGRVIQGRYETSKHLLESGVISGGDITTEAALAKMQLIFSNSTEFNQMNTSLTTPMRGEMSY